MRLPLSLFKIVVSVVFLLTVFSSVLGQEQTTPPTSPTPPPAPAIVGAAEIVVDRTTGTGSTVLNVRSTEQLNGGALTGLVNTDTEPRPQLTFKADQAAGEGQAVYPLTIAPKKITTVVATVTGVKQPGTFDADLAFDGNNFGKLKILYLPFAVTIDGPDPNKAELTLVDGEVANVTLKNADSVAYPVIWRLDVGGTEICGDQLTLPANGVGLIRCSPSVPFTPARMQDLFKVESTEGHSLLLYSVLPGTNASFDKSSPWKIIPVKASLSHFGPSSQQFWGYVGIIGVLILGGLTSLLLSQALPNRLRRLNIRERLMNTARTTANLTSSVGSRLQVLLRLERSRLYDLLESRNTFSPDFAGIAVRCNDATAKLESRVALAQQLDVVLDRLEQKLTQGPPPSQIAAIEALVDDAKVLLAKTELTDKDLEAAQTAITEAARRVDMLNEPDESFGQALAKRVIEVQNDIAANFVNDQVFVQLNTALPGPYKALRRMPNNTTTIVPAQCGELDMAVEKLLLIKEYILLYEGTQDQQMLQRLDQNRNKLLGFLQLQSWPAMRSARLLMRQMKDDVYPERLRQALLAKSATIVMKPALAYDRAPLEFCVCFNSDAVEKAAAREAWCCQWSFGDNLSETGWSASHYFLLQRTNGFKSPAAADFVVRASFLDDSGNVLNDPATNQPVTIEKPVNVRPSQQQQFFGDRARTELLKLMAALFIAVFALVSGAREQLMKLDILPGIIAVFTIGFGADTIKNLLTKSDPTP
jgi:hypothetical protein